LQSFFDVAQNFSGNIFAAQTERQTSGDHNQGNYSCQQGLEQLRGYAELVQNGENGENPN